VVEEDSDGKLVPETWEEEDALTHAVIVDVCDGDPVVLILAEGDDVIELDAESELEAAPLPLTHTVAVSVDVDSADADTEVLKDADVEPDMEADALEDFSEEREEAGEYETERDGEPVMVDVGDRSSVGRAVEIAELVEFGDGVKDGMFEKEGVMLPQALTDWLIDADVEADEDTLLDPLPQALDEPLSD